MNVSEMTKQAGLKLSERVKVAAAILTMHHYDRTQAILETAGEIKKTAALQYKVDVPDEVAIQAAADVIDGKVE